MIGIKCWTYKGEIIEGQGRRTRLAERAGAAPSTRDRIATAGIATAADRGDRGGDRAADLAPAQQAAAQQPSEQQAAVQAAAVQAAPADIAAGQTGRLRRIAPPLTPPQPSWKQEVEAGRATGRREPRGRLEQMNPDMEI